MQQNREQDILQQGREVIEKAVYDERTISIPVRILDHFSVSRGRHMPGFACFRLPGTKDMDEPKLAQLDYLPWNGQSLPT